MAVRFCSGLRTDTQMQLTDRLERDNKRWMPSCRICLGRWTGSRRWRNTGADAIDRPKEIIAAKKG